MRLISRSYNPITTTTDPDLACNNPGTVTDPQLSATVAAGSSVTAFWNNPWPHTIGPVMVYMAVSPRAFINPSEFQSDFASSPLFFYE